MNVRRSRLTLAALGLYVFVQLFVGLHLVLEPHHVHGAGVPQVSACGGHCAAESVARADADEERDGAVLAGVPEAHEHHDCALCKQQRGPEGDPRPVTPSAGAPARVAALESARGSVWLPGRARFLLAPKNSPPAADPSA